MKSGSNTHQPGGTAAGPLVPNTPQTVRHMANSQALISSFLAAYIRSVFLLMPPLN